VPIVGTSGSGRSWHGTSSAVRCVQESGAFVEMDIVLIVCCAIDVGLVALSVAMRNVIGVLVASIAFGLCFAGLVL